jgi:hypothetical protein
MQDATAQMALLQFMSAGKKQAVVHRALRSSDPRAVPGRALRAAERDERLARSNPMI